MGYDDRYNDNGSMRQKDLVLAPNEFCLLQSKTNGVIKTCTGPLMTTISQQEALVVFDGKTKKFKELSNSDSAKQLFINAPENWYVILKNPTENGTYPEVGKSMIAPALNIGQKVNIRGPVSFSLFPGQMAKVVRGHKLRSNQYLIARVYDAVAATENAASATIGVWDLYVGMEWDGEFEEGGVLVSNGTFTAYPASGDYVMIESEMDLDEEDLDTDCATVGGWATEKIGAMPDAFDSFDYKNLTILVKEVDEHHRILRLLILVHHFKKEDLAEED